MTATYGKMVNGLQWRVNTHYSNRERETENMSIHRSIVLLSSQVVGPVTIAYKRRIISGNLQSDSAQLLLSSKLDELNIDISLWYWWEY